MNPSDPQPSGTAIAAALSAREPADSQALVRAPSDGPVRRIRPDGRQLAAAGKTLTGSHLAEYVK